MAIAGILLLLWPALYNGYPFVYSDTGGYLAAGFGLESLPDRSMVYGLFIRFASLGVSLWGVAVVQAALLAYLITRTAQAFVAGIGPRGVLGIIAIVALLTPASWYASLIMMDVFAPILLLSAGLFVYGRHRAWEKGLLAVIAALSVTTHTAHPLIAVATLALSGAWLFWQRSRCSEFRDWCTRLLVIAGVVVCSTLAMMSANLAAFGQFTLNPSSHLFLMARLSETPLLKDYLERTLRARAVGALPGAARTPVRQRPGIPVASSRGRRGRNRLAPGEARIRPDHPRHPDLAVGIRLLRRRLPGERRAAARDPATSSRSIPKVPARRPRSAFSNSFRGRRRPTWRPGSSTAALAFAQAFEWIQLVCASWLRWAARARHRPRALAQRILHFVVFVCGGVIVNALVMGGLSEVNGRYQARVAWLVVLLALVVYRRPRETGR